MDTQSAIDILKQMINAYFYKVEDLKLLLKLFYLALNQYNKTETLPGQLNIFFDYTESDLARF